MKVICTKTGECEKGGGFNSLHCLNGTEQWEQEHYASCPYRVRTGLAEVIELIPRAEALRIARETLEKAEKERAEIAMSVALSLGDEAEEYAAAFDSLIACYEELAEAHRLGNDIYQALMRVRIEEVQPECPGPGWYWTRGYWKPPRRSKLAAIEPDQGTVQADPPAGEIGPLQGQGEQILIGGEGTANSFDNPGDHDATVTNFQGVEGKDWHYTEAFQWQGEVQCPIPQSGEERSE
jgi:hypothetical protein